MPVNGPMNLDIDVRGLQVANLVGLAESDLTAAGTVDFRARLAGTQRSPEIRGAFSLMNASYRGAPIPDLRNGFQYSNEKLVAHAEMLRNGGQPLAHVDVDAPINLALAGATTPRVLDRPLKVDFVADSLPLDALPRFTDAVSDVHGRIIGSIAARGTGTKPVVLGQLGLDFATFKLAALGVTARDMGGLLHMNGKEIVIDTIGARSGEGVIGIKGKIGIADATNPKFDLKFDATDATVLDNDIGELHATAAIAVAGPMDGVSVTGRARIVHGTVYIPNGNGPRQVSTDDPAVIGVVDTADVAMKKVVTTASPVMRNMKMNVRLGVARDTWARSPDANVEFYTQGPLTLVKSAGDPAIAIDGVVNTERGEYQFLGRRFVLSHGNGDLHGHARRQSAPAARRAVHDPTGGTAGVEHQHRNQWNGAETGNRVVERRATAALAIGPVELSRIRPVIHLVGRLGGRQLELRSRLGERRSRWERGRFGDAPAHRYCAGRDDASVRGNGRALARRGRVHHHARRRARSGCDDRWRADHSRGNASGGREVRRSPNLCRDANPRSGHDAGIRRAASALEGIPDRSERGLALHRQPADAFERRADSIRGGLWCVPDSRVEVLISR
jgi:Uncharacterized protein conserved in bacteria